MSFSFLAPAFLWTLLTIPLVIALHFIRARKKRYDVSALFLWKKAQEIAETRRRFSPTWLLIAQLLFVSLAALALARPHFSFAGPPDRIVIIDASASMAARDSDGVRLDKAIREASSLMSSSGRVAVIRAGLDATVLQPLSSDKREATRALETVRAIDKEADLERALSLALASAENAEVHIFTDGDAPLASQVVLHPVGGDGLNLGISTFDLGLQQAFVAVVSNHPRPQEVRLELIQDSAIVAQSNLLVPAGGQANVSLPLLNSSGFFEARLAVPEWDALGLDNSAVAGKRDLRVVLSSADTAVDKALRSIPNLSFQVLSSAAPNAPGFDVRVVTGALPEGATGRYLLFAPPSPLPDYQVIRSWDRSDPLLRFVDLTETIVGLNSEGLVYDNSDWQVLAQTGDLRPILLKHKSAELEVVAANFHPSQTDMTNRTAFPLLITNIMNSFRQEEQLTFGAPLPDGTTLLANNREVPVSEVAQAGIYTIDGRRYAASLETALESRLPSLAELPSSSSTGLAAQERVRSFAIWLVALAALFLLFEWLIWSRRRGRGWAIPLLSRLKRSS